MIVGLCMARNEAAYIGEVLDHLWANGVDRIVVEDGTSTDLTVDVCREHGATVVRETDRAYDQPARMSHLAGEWCDPGDWVIPFDADEWWCAPGGLRKALSETEATKCWANVFQHRDRDHRARDMKPHPKVAFRWMPDVQIAFGNHSVTRDGPDDWTALEIREWQYRSFDHFMEKIAKQRDLLANSPDLNTMYGAHKNVLTHMDAAELEVEWVRMQDGEWVYDPIPSWSSRHSTVPTSSPAV